MTVYMFDCSTDSNVKLLVPSRKIPEAAKQHCKGTWKFAREIPDLKARDTVLAIDSKKAMDDISRQGFHIAPTIIESGVLNPMSQVPWFERKFAPFPVEQLPNLFTRLRGTPARLEDVLRGRSHDSLVRKPDGKWSAQENAGHLLDLEPLWLTRLDDYVAAREQLTVADVTNRKTTEAKHNARELEEILVKFRSARERLLRSVERLDPSLFSRSAIHPRLKTPMRLVDHWYFVAEHDDHHLARIWELIQQ